MPRIAGPSETGRSIPLHPSIVFRGVTRLPIVLEAAERVLAACRVRQIAVAINAEEPETARRWIERGVQMVACSSDLGMVRRQSALLLDPLADLLRRR